MPLPMQPDGTLINPRSRARLRRRGGRGRGPHAGCARAARAASRRPHVGRPGASRWQFWRSPPDQPRWARPALLLVAALAALSYSWGSGSAQLETFYGARGAQHVAELARLLLRCLRPVGHGLGRQVARSLLGPGAVRPPLRLPHLGHGAAPGHRGDADRPRPLPRRPPRRRRRGRTRRRRRPGRDAGHHPVEPRQHLGLAAHSAAGAGGGRHHGRLHDGPAAVPRARGRLGRPRLPGQDAPGLDRPPRALPRLHPGGAGGQPGTAGRAGRPLRPRRGRRLAELDVRRHPRSRRTTAPTSTAAATTPSSARCSSTTAPIALSGDLLDQPGCSPPPGRPGDVHERRRTDPRAGEGARPLPRRGVRTRRGVALRPCRWPRWAASSWPAGGGPAPTPGAPPRCCGASGCS